MSCIAIIFLVAVLALLGLLVLSRLRKRPGYRRCTHVNQAYQGPLRRKADQKTPA